MNTYWRRLHRIAQLHRRLKVARRKLIDKFRGQLHVEKLLKEKTVPSEIDALNYHRRRGPCCVNSRKVPGIVTERSI